MFAKTIIDSDAFLDMPQSSQLLYFHLSMRADDEGFINNPRSIMRNVRCTEEDILQLINKKFIIPFDNGIVVIKHWKIHNYIAKDRFKETKYKEEKATLFLDENKAYTLNNPAPEIPPDTPCIQSVYKMDTQVRLGKDRLSKDRLEEERENKEKEEAVNTGQQLADLFNTLCPSLPSVEILSDSILSDIAISKTKYSIDKFKTLFEKAEKSDFLKGNNKQDWVATFDWLIKADNVAKVLNGNFDNRRKKSVCGPSYDLEAFERMLNAKDNPPPTAADDENIKRRAEALKEQFAVKN